MDSSSPNDRLAPDRADARFIRRLLIVVVVAALVWALIRAGDLPILAFGSILGAIVIHAVAGLYTRYARVPARAALVLGMATTLALLGFLGWLFAVAFRDQVVLLVTRGPAILDGLSASLSTSPFGAKVVSAVKAAYAGSRVARDIGGLVAGGGEIVLNFLILLFGALFFAGDPAVYGRGFLLLVPPAKRPAFEDALFDLASTLRLWLQAQLIQMTTMGLLVGLGLWAVGTPSAAALGLLTGLSEFIPYVGPIAAMLPALGLAATQGGSQGAGPVLWVLGVFIGVRIVQSNLITPFVTGRVISIPPAVTLFTIIAIGYVLGLFGLFFSAALLVVAFTLVRSLYLREVLGEPIPRAEHRTLIGTPRQPDSRAFTGD